MLFIKTTPIIHELCMIVSIQVVNKIQQKKWLPFIHRIGVHQWIANYPGLTAAVGYNTIPHILPKR